MIFMCCAFRVLQIPREQAEALEPETRRDSDSDRGHEQDEDVPVRAAHH